jgi:hypothetical protein
MAMPQAGQTLLAIDFVAHNMPGSVTVRCQANTDPERLGFGLLGLPFPPERARGFPVVEATVAYAGQGYHAWMAWLQVVRWREADGPEQFEVDRPPQLRGLDYPFCVAGPRPLLIDAPVMDEAPVDWWATAFLVVSPDAIMRRVVEPVCCFRWGYVVDAHGAVSIRAPVAQPLAAAWQEFRGRVAAQHPSWTLR